MLLALTLFTGAFVNLNPGAIGAPRDASASGVLKTTRHPTFVAVVLFAIAHLLMNGWVGDVLFFGSLGLLAVLGGLHQDRRKLRELGAPYQQLLDSTSFFPVRRCSADARNGAAPTFPSARLGSAPRQLN